MDWKEIVIVSVLCAICCALIIGSAMGLTNWTNSATCNAVGPTIGYPYKYGFWEGCEIEVTPGQWIPLSNYRYVEP